MTDLTRLMFDDGAQRKPVLSTAGAVATFNHKGQQWAAYRYDGTERLRGWHVVEPSVAWAKGTSYDLEWLRNDPDGFARRWWGSLDQPGWASDEYPQCNEADRFTIYFVKIQ